jgi:hypothetical protein
LAASDKFGCGKANDLEMHCKLFHGGIEREFLAQESLISHDSTMFVPRSIGDWVHKNLPASIVTALDRLYAPYLDWMSERINNRLLQKLFPSEHLTVKAGPFKGMSYIPQSNGSVLIPKLIGTYEQELHGVLEEALRKKYRTLLDIGCAEGYYLIGLALRLPNLQAHGFDLNAEALKNCERLAKANGVAQRITLHGRCTTQFLDAMSRPGTLIICDCEGAELELLDPKAAPNLKNADILVELHERLVPGVTKTIQQRFSSTHHVRLIEDQRRNPKDCKIISTLSKREQCLAVDEMRGEKGNWAFMEIKNSLFSVFKNEQ